MIRLIILIKQLCKIMKNTFVLIADKLLIIHALNV